MSIEDQFYGLSKFDELDNLLNDIFNDVLRLFIRCYNEIVNKKEKFIKKDIKNNSYEDYYRNILIIKYLPLYSKEFGLDTLKFIPGSDEIDPITYISKGNPDIKIININLMLNEEFRFNDDIFFTFECKRFGDNATPKLYVEKGIKRFVEKKGSGYKYSSNLPFAGMIGFIEEGDTADIISKINKKLEKYTMINTLKNLTTEHIETGFNQSYSSIHRRDASSEITLHHIMYDYNDIVQ